MLSSIKRSLSLVAASVAAAACVMAGAPTASAATGNWGWQQRALGYAYGTNLLGNFSIACLSATGCGYTSGFHLSLTASDGASLVPPLGGSFPFIRSDTNAQVGTCSLQSSSLLDCSTTSAGTIPLGFQLTGVGSGGAAVVVPIIVPLGSPVATFSWYDTNGMFGNDPVSSTLQMYLR